jgi:AcrR family transcriptional regulator
VARTVNLAEHAARRDAILDAAQRLILSKGYERLTIQDILDELQISKGAFYHYFDCKPAVIEALTQRLVDASVEALAPIVQDGELAALDKLQRFFGEVIRFKSARQNLFVAMLPHWYAPENIVFRQQLDRAVAQRLAPLLAVIVGQGVAEGRFATAYPEHAGPIVIALVQALQDAMAQQLLAAARRSPEAPSLKQMVATYGAHIEAIERYLGAPAGALYRADSRTISSWMSALRQDQTDKSVPEGTQ